MAKNKQDLRIIAGGQPTPDPVTARPITMPKKSTKKKTKK